MLYGGRKLIRQSGGKGILGRYKFKCKGIKVCLRNCKFFGSIELLRAEALTALLNVSKVAQYRAWSTVDNKYLLNKGMNERSLDLVLYFPLAEPNWKPVGKGVLEISFVGVSL